MAGTVIDLKAFMEREFLARRGPPGLLMISPYHKAIFDTLNQFEGRDRRRIKRELRKMNRAWKRDHRPASLGGISRASNGFWNTRSAVA